MPYYNQRTVEKNAFGIPLYEEFANLSPSDYVGTDGNTYSADHWQVDANDIFVLDDDGNKIPDPNPPASATPQVVNNYYGSDGSASDGSGDSGSSGSGDSGGGSDGGGSSGGGSPYTPPYTLPPVVAPPTVPPVLTTLPPVTPPPVTKGIAAMGDGSKTMSTTTVKPPVAPSIFSPGGGGTGFGHKAIVHSSGSSSKSISKKAGIGSSKTVSFKR